MGEPPTTPPDEAGDAGERSKAFDALAEVSADGIITIDDRSIIRYVNPAVERILGYDPSELRGEPLVTIIPDRLNQGHVEAFERYLETGEKHLDWTYIELPGCHKDSHEVPLGISFNEFTHDSNRYFVGTFRDISQRKEVEQKLEQQNEQLNQFANLLAHELRNPLEIAQIYLDFLDDSDEATINEIAEALDQIDQIIEVLLILARNQNDVVDREPVSLTGVVKDAWTNTTTGDAVVEVKSTQVLRVNPTHLQLLLENLFRNAIEHSDGTVTVRVGALDDGFYVEDTGPGIPEDKSDTVVEAGFTTDADGIGLGLTFVTQLADIYGWEFAIMESDEGGARFEFTDVETIDEACWSD